MNELRNSTINVAASASTTVLQAGDDKRRSFRTTAYAITASTTVLQAGDGKRRNPSPTRFYSINNVPASRRRQASEPIAYAILQHQQRSCKQATASVAASEPIACAILQHHQRFHNGYYRRSQNLFCTFVHVYSTRGQAVVVEYKRISEQPCRWLEWMVQLAEHMIQDNWRSAMSQRAKLVGGAAGANRRTASATKPGSNPIASDKSCGVFHAGTVARVVTVVPEPARSAMYVALDPSLMPVGVPPATILVMQNIVYDRTHAVPSRGGVGRT